MRFKGAAKGWQASAMDKLQPETIPPLGDMETIGLDVKPEEPIFADELPEGWTFMQHGLVKGALLLLGVSHQEHDGVFIPIAVPSLCSMEERVSITT